MNRPSALKNKPNVTKVNQKPKRFIPDSVLKKMPNRASESAMMSRPEPRPNPFDMIKRKKMVERQHYGQKVLSDIRRFQDSTDTLIPKTSFQKLVRSVCM